MTVRTIRIWSLTSGESIHILYGHDSFVYSLSPIPDYLGGGLISGGEDRTMRVWRGEYFNATLHFFFESKFELISFSVLN